jgi:tetratricopeptide (TPR) repeat protein
LYPLGDRSVPSDIDRRHDDVVSRRLVSRAAGPLLIAAVASALIALGTHRGWWQAIAGHRTASWNWVERVSWLCAIISTLLTVWYEQRARRTADGDDRRITSIGFFNIVRVFGDDRRTPQPQPARETAAEIPLRNQPVNHDPERVQLEEALNAPGSAVVLVYGAAGVGKTTLVDGVLDLTGLDSTSETYDLTGGGEFGAAELVRVIGKDLSAPAIGLRDDMLQWLDVSLETADDPALAVVIDGAQHLLELDTNHIADLELNEALAAVAARRSRRVKVILITHEQPVAAQDSTWTSGDAVLIPVRKLSPSYFAGYLRILDPADSADLHKDADRWHDVLQGLPRNANLLWAALILARGRRSPDDLFRELDRSARKDMASTLARMVVGYLSLPQRRCIAALVAYDMPVNAHDVRELLGTGNSPGRVERQLLELAEHHIIARLPTSARYCVTDPEIVAALERDDDELDNLRRDAALALSYRRKPQAQVHRPGDLAVELTELRITLRNHDWMAAYERIEQIDSHLVRWNASGLLVEAREKVVDNLEDRFEELRNYNALGYAHASRRELVEARQAYRKALELAKAQYRPDELRRTIYTNLGHLAWQTNDTSEAEKQYRRALKLADRDDDDADRIVALSGLSDCRRRQGDHRQAVELGERALTLAQTSGNRTWQVDLGIKVARWLSEQNRRPQAWALMVQAGKVAREQPLGLIARCYDGETDLLLDGDDISGAKASAGEALRRALDSHDPVTVLQARTTLAMAHLRLGELDPVRAAIDRAIGRLRRGGPAQSS